MTGDDARAQIEVHIIERGNALLARIDEHLARGIADTSAEHLAKGVELEARLEDHIARRAEFLVAEDGEDDRWRFAMRLDNLRSERAFGEISQTLVRRSSELVRYFADEGRAHRDALCRIVDRLAREDMLTPAGG